VSFRGGYRHSTRGQGSPPISWGEAFGWAMGESLKAISARQRAAADVRTGALRGSIGFDPPRVTSGRVEGVTFAGGGAAPYAKAHEYGSGLHSEAPDSRHALIVIVPKHARALRFARRGTGASPLMGLRPHASSSSGPNLQVSGTLQVRGVVAFARRVVQEGQEPRSYMRKGLEEAAGEVMDYVKQAAEMVLGRG